MRGSVVYFVPTKGYGFIKPDAGGEDIFVHALALRRCGLPENLAVGARLSFDVEAAPGGKLRAANLVDISAAEGLFTWA